MSDDSREPPATLAVDGSAPPSVPRSSPRASPEPSAPLEHEHEHEDEDDRDELEDEGEDAASSEGRARTPDPPSAAPASSLDSVSAAASEAAKSVMPVGGKTQAAFVHKVWSMVETPALQNLISWSGDGKSFLVYSPEEFARTVLPQYFKHSNFASFLRQLNFYSWSKVNDVLGANTPTTKPDGTPVQAWEFRNPNFQRGRPDLLVRIKRKTAKSTATASPAASRRRSSVTTLASLRPTRREGAPTNEAARHAVDEERDLDAVSSSMASGSNSGSGVGPSRSREELAAPSSTRVATGLADFAPYTNEGPAAPVRVKDEGEYPASTRTSPPSYPRHAPPQPTYSFPHAYSPGTRAYPLPHTTTYPSYRYSYTEEPLARQVHALEGQVRGLSEALYYSQQEFMSARTTSYGVLQTLLGVVASLDPEGRKKDELQAASYALSKIAPDASPTQAYSNPFPFAYGPPPWPPSNGLAFPSPRPSTAQSASQFYYNRVPAAESYTRTSRPDSRTDFSATQTTAPHPSAPSAVGVGLSFPSSQPPPTSFSAPLKQHQPVAPSSRPSSRPHSSGHDSPAAYPSPRLSWAQAPSGVVGPAPGSSHGVDAAGSKGSTTLPPLSALLNPAGGPPPSFGGAERRAYDTGEDVEDRARKKQRQ